MFVFHQNSDVEVTLNNALVPDNEDLYPYTLSLPEGRHLFTWQAETQLNPILDLRAAYRADTDIYPVGTGCGERVREVFL